MLEDTLSEDYYLKRVKKSNKNPKFEQCRIWETLGTGSSVHATSVTLVCAHVPMSLLYAPRIYHRVAKGCCALQLGHSSPLPPSAKVGRCMKLRCTKRLRSSSETAALTRFAPALAAFNGSTTSNCAREVRTKLCNYPGHNFCNGFREGTKQPFLAQPLWAAHTRAIKEASCWDASIPVSCLKASALCSCATAMAGALPAAGRAPLPLRVFWSQFSISQLSRSHAEPAAASVPLLLLPCSSYWLGPLLPGDSWELVSRSDLEQEDWQRFSSGLLGYSLWIWVKQFHIFPIKLPKSQILN